MQCPVCDSERIKKESVALELHGISTYGVKFVCGSCDHTWLSAREEHEIDRRVIAGLEAERDRYREALEGLIRHVVHLYNTDNALFMKLKNGSDEWVRRAGEYSRHLQTFAYIRDEIDSAFAPLASQPQKEAE